MSDLLTNSVEFLSGGTVVLFADIVIKATVLLLLVIAANAVLRRRSAAVRHRLWSLAFCGLLSLPLLATLLPSWRLPILPPVADTAVAEAEAHTRSSRPATDRSEDTLNDRSEAELQFESTPTDSFVESDEAALVSSQNSSMEFGGNLATDDVGVAPADDTKALAVASGTEEEPAVDLRFSGYVVFSTWGLGFMIAAWPLAIGFIRNAALQKTADRVDEDATQSTQVRELSLSLGLRRRVQLMETCRSIVPITWGILRPIVLFPVAWREWTIERRELVLLHELAHVKRLDVAWQLVARLVCALYWFHPLAWYALRRLRIERELACDDCVLMTGALPSLYARELVDMATNYQFLVLPTTVAMAHTTNLEQRVLSLLDRARSHVAVGRIAGRLLLAVAAIVVTGIAIVRPSAKASNATPAEMVQQAADDDTNPDAAAPEDAEAISQEVDDSKSVTVRGTVLLPNGSPAVEATVLASPGEWAMLRPLVGPDYKVPVALAKTDEQGHFEINVTKQPYGDLSGYSEQWQNVWKQTIIAASLPGYGGQWVHFQNIEDKSKASLKLVEDHPVNGRVIDLEGQPISGLEIQIGGPFKADDEDLSKWIEAAKAGEVPWTLYKHTPSQVAPKIINVVSSVRTGDDGRFELRGMGRERQFDVTVVSESVAHATFGIATRKMATFERMIIDSGKSGNPTQNVFGSDFAYTATMSRPVVGVIRESETGEPMAGVRVESYKLSGYPYSNHRVLKAVTDENGAYRLVGMPKGKGNQILVLPNDDQTYLIRRADVPNTKGMKPVTVDVDLHKGVLITGRVIDRATGEPVHARLHYLPYRSNTFAQAAPEFTDGGSSESDQMRYQTKQDGTYRLVGLPGAAIVGAESVHKDYRRGVGSDEVNGPKYKSSPNFDTYRNPLNPGPNWPNALKEIDVDEGTDSIVVDFELDSGPTVNITTLDDKENPITGVRVTNSGAIYSRTYDTHKFKIGQQKTNVHVAAFRKGDLGWIQEIPSPPPSDGVTVRMQPVATVTGRLMLDDKTPLTGARIQATAHVKERPNGLPETTTDANGHFKLTLLPGVEYLLRIESSQLELSVASTADRIAIEPGEAKSLGELRLTGRQFRPVTASEVNSSTTTVDSVRGHVAGPSGEPQEGAFVWVAQQEIPELRWISEWQPTKWKRIAQSAKDGSFKAALSLKTGSSVRLAATAPGLGWVWKDLQAADFNDEVTFQLVKDLPIEGRILSLDGKPTVGVKLTVNHMTEKSPGSTLDEIVRATVGSSGVYTNCPSPPLNGGGPEFTSVATGADGRFRIEGMGANRSVRLEAIGGGIGASRFRIFTRATPEKLKPHGAVDVREGLPESTYFATFTHVATPARTLRGTVTDKTTGKPIAGVNISSRLSWHIMLNPVMTDANGRYEITGVPKMEKYRPLIFEPSETRHFNHEIAITDSPGLDPLTLDVTLATGISVKGRLTDRESGQPLSGTLMYSPLSGNENWRTIGDPDVANPAAMSVIGDDGTYEISVLPGPGVLTVRTTATGYVPPKIDTKRLGELTTDIMKDARGGVTAVTTQAGEQSHGLVGMFDKHALALINPSSDTTQLTVDLTAIRGRSLEGTILDDKGKPLAGVKASGLGPGTNSDAPLRTEDFTVRNLAPGQKRTLYFHHADRKLGAAVVVDGQPEKPLSVRLQSTGSIKLRFVDRLGQPLPDIEVEAVGSWGSWNHTDADGRIEISDIVANTEYWIRAKPATQRGPSLYVTKVIVEPGQSLNVGTFTRKNRSQYKPVGKEEAKVKTAKMPIQEFTVKGRVVTPDGKPASNANVFVGLPDTGGTEREIRIAKSMTSAVDKDGSFTVQYSHKDLFENPEILPPDLLKEAERNVLVAATADGFGLTWKLSSEFRGNEPTTLQLVEDQAVTGRLISSEGKPVPKAQVRIESVQAAPDENIQSWIDRLKDGQSVGNASNASQLRRIVLNVTQQQPQTVTDSDGRFRFTGIGKDRVIRLSASAPTIARQFLQIVNRETETLPTNVRRDSRYSQQVYGTNSNGIVVAASQPIAGVVRDADTGEPLANVTIESCRLAGSNVIGVRTNLLTAKTNDKGEFELRGMPKGKGNRLLAVPNDEQPYFMREIPVPKVTGLSPIQVEVELHRGIWIEGKVVDAESGSPVFANLYYLPFLDNKYAGKLPEFTTLGNGYIDGASGYQHRYRTNRDGTFRIVGLPGRAIVGAATMGGFFRKSYRSGAGAEDIEGIKPNGQFPTYTGPLAASLSWPNTMAEVNPAADAQSASVTLKADVGVPQQIRVTDQKGKRLTDYWVSGETSGSDWNLVAKSDFVVSGLGKDQSRTILIQHTERNLGKVIRIAGGADRSKTLEVQLEPDCTVTGRLLDSVGQPIPNVNLRAFTEPSENFNPLLRGSVSTDKQGRFTFSHVPTGCDYRLTGRSNAMENLRLNDIRFTAKPGAKVDLGTMTVGDNGRIVSSK